MLNVITLVGRLTRDPELRRTNAGTAVGAFSVACDEGAKAPNGEKKVLFIDCTVFDKQADTLVKYFHKGNLIGVTGRLISRKYVNKQGVNVTAYEIMANRIEFIESASKSEGEKSEPNPGIPPVAEDFPVTEKKNTESLELTDDELPF